MIDRETRRSGAAVRVVSNEFETTIAAAEVQPASSDQPARVDWRQNPDVHAFSAADAYDMATAWEELAANVEQLNALHRG